MRKVKNKPSLTKNRQAGALPVAKVAFKGILHQKIFYRPNLIFWIVMRCGIAHFGRRGLKIAETSKFWSKNLSPGVLRRGGPGVSRHSTRGFKGQQHGVSRGSNMGFRGAATLIEHLSDLSFPAVPRGPIWPPGTSRDGTTDGTIVTALHCTTVHKKFSHKIEFFYTIQPSYRVFIRLVRP